MLTKIFCEIGDFMKEFEAVYKSKLLSEDKEERIKNSKFSSDANQISINTYLNFTTFFITV